MLDDGISRRVGIAHRAGHCWTTAGGRCPPYTIALCKCHSRQITYLANISENFYPPPNITWSSCTSSPRRSRLASTLTLACRTGLSGHALLPFFPALNRLQNNLASPGGRVEIIPRCGIKKSLTVFDKSALTNKTYKYGLMRYHSAHASTHHENPGCRHPG
jgi:hypothetical protein